MLSSGEPRAIGVGILGLGRTGWGNHGGALEALPQMYRVVAASDGQADRRQEAEQRFGCRTYGELDGLLGDADVELLVVATPSHVHCDHTVAALRAGKHVLCEKPMTTTVEQVDRMIEAAQEAERVLTVFQSARYHPDFLKVREVIASGVIGRVFEVRILNQTFGRRWDWQALRSLGGGVLYNLGSHWIDQALLLLGDGNPDVNCWLESTPLTAGDAEDHAKVVLTSDDGESPVVEVEITSACAYPLPHWQILGTRGGLTGSMSQLQWKWIDADQLEPRTVKELNQGERRYEAEELSWQEDSWTAPRGVPKGKQFYEDLYQTLRHGAPLAVTPQSVRRQIAVLEECHAKGGR